MSSFNTGLNFGNQFQLKPPKRSRRKKQEQQSEELDPGIIKSLGGAALGTVGAVGNLLNLPGSSVRDILAGQNPFDQWVSPFSDTNRVSGRELNRSYGMAGKEDTWGNFAGGMATEILTDPLPMLGAVFLGKTAKGAAIAKTGGETAKSLGAGIRSGERALVSGKVPFVKGSEWALGTGKRAAKVGDVLDKIYDAARFSAPGRYAAATFDPRVMGATTKEAQIAARDIVYPEIQKANKESRHMMIDIAKRLEKLGITDSDTIRSEFEGIHKGVIHEKDPGLLNLIHGHLNSEIAQDKYWGRPSRKLEDMYAEYFPRYISLQKRGKGEAVGKVFSGISQSDQARGMATKDWLGGTKAVKNFFKDQDLAEMSKWMEEHRRTMVKTASLDDIPRIDNAFVDHMANAIRQKYAGEFEPAFTLKGETFDRARELAKAYLNSSNLTREDGLYTNNPLIDLFKKTVTGTTKRAKIKGMIDSLKSVVPEDVRRTWANSGKNISDPDKWARMKVGKIKRYHPAAATSELGVNLGEVTSDPNFYSLFKSLKMDHRRMAGVLLRESGIPVNRRSMKMLLESTLPQNIYDDLSRGYDKTVLPKSLEKAMSLPDQATNLFKAGVLSHPARHFRDATGGYVQNLIHGLTNPLSRFREASTVMEGGHIKGLAKALSNDPEVLNWIKGQGLTLSDETATDAIRHLYAAEGPGSTFKHNDITGATNPSTEQSIADILSQVPGNTKKSSWERWKEIGSALSGRDGNASWNPKNWKTRGVAKSGDSTFPLFAASDKTGEWIDTLNRLDPFIQLKKKGYSSRKAMDIINSVQANYDPSTFTATEKQVFKRLFPFYSFTSRMAKHTAKELATKPGGGLANVIRLQNAARDKSGMTPDHIADTASIPDPFFKSTDGTQQYLTSLGLMHEDPLQFMQPSLQNVTGEVLSRLNPLAQKAIETGTGRSLFFKEPGGGRPLEDLDPTIGRILANVTGAKDAIKYPGDWAVEGVNSLLPTSRLTTTVRQLTDPRKSPSTKALSALTGLKITTVSPQQQERTLRRKLEEVARSLGGRTFEQIYFPKDKEYTGQAKERVEAYKTIINALSKRAKSRSKDKLKK